MTAGVLGIGARHRDAARDTGFTVDVDRLAGAEWERLASEFEDSSCDQTSSWVDGRWGPRRSSHLVLRRDGAVVAGARVVVLQWPGLRRGIAYVKFGPLWRRRDVAPDLAVYRRCVDALVEEYCVRRGHCLTVLPRPTPGWHAEESEALAALGFAIRRPMLDPNRYLVDVALEPAAQMQSLGQKWRYNLRQALASDLECRPADGESGFETFRALHARMFARKRMPQAEPLDVMPALVRQLPQRMRPRVVLAWRGDVPVAGAIVMAAGDTAYYLFGASDDSALPLKAGYALQWWIVQWLPALRVRWYDLGGEGLEPGLRQFKKGLVGKRGEVVTTRGELDRWTRPFGRLAADAIYGLRNVQRVLRGRRTNGAAREGDGASGHRLA